MRWLYSQNETVLILRNVRETADLPTTLVLDSSDDSPDTADQNVVRTENSLGFSVPCSMRTEESHCRYGALERRFSPELDRACGD
jgi:hypothetical protein